MTRLEALTKTVQKKKKKRREIHFSTTKEEADTQNEKQQKLCELFHFTRYFRKVQLIGIP